MRGEVVRCCSGGMKLMPWLCENKLHGVVEICGDDGTRKKKMCAVRVGGVLAEKAWWWPEEVLQVRGCSC